jgi:hypothetical protein
MPILVAFDLDIWVELAVALATSAGLEADRFQHCSGESFPTLAFCTGVHCHMWYPSM